MKGQFSTAWKNAIVSPILKNSSLDPLYKNYRPISNIPFISKIIEKAALSQYTPHLNSFSSFFAHNSAYKPLHSTETLHWLPVNFRIKYKILLIAYKCVNYVVPIHIQNHISIYVPNRPLRSLTAEYLVVPRAKTSFGTRSFAYAAPHLWNSLPFEIRTASSLTVFKNKLKTFFFNEAFN